MPAPQAAALPTAPQHQPLGVSNTRTFYILCKCIFDMGRLLNIVYYQGIYMTHNFQELWLHSKAFFAQVPGVPPMHGMQSDFYEKMHYETDVQVFLETRSS